MAIPPAGFELTTPDGTTLRGDVSGPAERPVAVLLHGVGSTTDFVRRCLADAAAAAGYRVVAYDLRGHGRSTPSADPAFHAIEHHVADLDAVAERYDVRLVGGISLGGHVGAAWAAGRDDLDGVLMCLPGRLDPASLPAAANAQAADELARDGVSAALARMAGETGVPAWVVEEVHASWPTHDPASLVAALRAVATEPVRDDLARVTAPVGLVGLTDDPAHPWDAAVDCAAMLPRATLVASALADLADDRGQLGRLAVQAWRAATG